MSCGNAALRWMCGLGVRGDYKKVCVQTDFRQLVVDMIRKLLVEEVELFLVQAWMIWTQRNVVTNGGTLQDPSQLVKRASIFFGRFQSIPGAAGCIESSSEGGEMGSTTWKLFQTKF